MQVHLLKSKVHRAQVTASSLDYEGSLTIARDLMEQVGDRLTNMRFTEGATAQAAGWQPRLIVLGAKNAVIDVRGT